MPKRNDVSGLMENRFCVFHSAFLNMWAKSRNLIAGFCSKLAQLKGYISTDASMLSCIFTLSISIYGYYPGKRVRQVLKFSIILLQYFFFENSSAHSVQNVQQYILLKDLILRSLYVFEWRNVWRSQWTLMDLPFPINAVNF